MRHSSSLPFSPPKVTLAPLSGISSLPFRMVNRALGCQFAFTEMVSARSLSYTTKKTMVKLATSPDDRPLGVQLLGNDVTYLLSSIEKLAGYHYDVLDFNAACPRRKVTGKGHGAALLNEPKKLQSLLSALVKESPVPVTVKLRIGWADNREAVTIAQHVQDAGVSAIYLHGRTRMQEYRSPVSYERMRQVKEAVSIPVLGSGDVWSASLAKKLLDETGCDGVVVARGALGNPWIFREIDAFLAGETQGARPSAVEVAQIMRDHLARSIEFYGEYDALRQFRKFFIWYTRGFPRVKPLRVQVIHAATSPAMNALIAEFLSCVR